MENVKRNQGFTLIELLVVVLIIGILAAVAVPQYQKAAERSKASQALMMLSAIYKSYQAYYLANGKYAKTFEGLDIDIPFSGKTEATSVDYINAIRSNKDWSFEIQERTTTVTLYATRITGKYKGAGFYINILSSKKPIYCQELKIAHIPFDTNLPSGAYCEQIMKGAFKSENDYARFYTLP